MPPLTLHIPKQTAVQCSAHSFHWPRGHSSSS